MIKQDRISYCLMSVCRFACVCKNGCTPLHWHSNKRHIEVARLLLDRGADIEAVDVVSKNIDDVNRLLHQLLSHACMYVC